MIAYNSDYTLPWGWVKFGGAVEGHANFNSSGAAPVTAFEFGMSPFGCYQMAGNASEWCLNEVTDGFTVAGGSWKDILYLFSDIGAFRNGRWTLEQFLRAIRLGVEWAIEHKAVYDLLSHPSCLVAMDPEMQAIDLVLDLVRQGRDRAEIVSLDAIAKTVL